MAFLDDFDLAYSITIILIDKDRFSLHKSQNRYKLPLSKRFTALQRDYAGVFLTPTDR